MSSTARLEPGFMVSERYRIGEPLGEGGMGVVYSAEHLHMRKLFALKVLHRELLQLPEVVARFEREAVLAGSIDHPNVAAATDFGKLPDGSFYLVLELVTGLGLRAVIGEQDPRPIEVVRAHGIMRGITAGIVAAHAKGIVHRDLKPENVMLVERDGSPDFAKVLDFGIAKGAAAEAPSASPLTQIGTIMGTPQYMAPEQALGQLVDQRSDLYSLGVIFYEMITGQPPFSGDALVVLRHHIATEAQPIAPELTAGLTVPIASIIAKLLAKDPNDRYQSAAELAAALEEPAVVASAVTAIVEPAPAPAKPEKAPRKLPPKTIALIAAGATAIGIGLVVMFASSSKPKLTTNEVQAASVEIGAPPAETASAAPVATEEAAEEAPVTPPPEETVEAPAPSPPAPAVANQRAESPATQNARNHGGSQGKVYKKRGPIGTLGQDVKNLFRKRKGGGYSHEDDAEPARQGLSRGVADARESRGGVPPRRAFQMG